MRTLIGMVTIGPDNWTRRYSVARAKAYATKHGYEFLQVTEPAIKAGERTPHWEKLLIPKLRPDFDRYLIIDDDILINHRIAPALPDTPAEFIGLVREPLPELNQGEVRWVANSGMMVVSRGSCDLLDAAYEEGEIKEIVPGFGEQPAVNKVAWTQKRIHRMEWKWNYILMADWLIHAHGQTYPWKAGRLLGLAAKFTLTIRVLSSLLFRQTRPADAGSVMGRFHEAYFVHLIAFRMGARIVDMHLG